MQAPKKQPTAAKATILDMNEGGGAAAAAQMARASPSPRARRTRTSASSSPTSRPTAGAWGAVYRVVYDHLTRLPRRAHELPQAPRPRAPRRSTCEPDFQKIAKYYGVDPRTLGELAPPQAALAALAELATHARARHQAPRRRGRHPQFRASPARLDGGLPQVFISLRDGYRPSRPRCWRATGVDRRIRSPPPRTRRSSAASCSHPARSPTPRASSRHLRRGDEPPGRPAQRRDGGHPPLVKLSPRAIEEELERKGKKGLFSSRYESSGSSTRSATATTRARTNRSSRSSSDRSSSAPTRPPQARTIRAQIRPRKRRVTRWLHPRGAPDESPRTSFARRIVGPIEHRK
jgi:type VI secretion system protein ImpI